MRWIAPKPLITILLFIGLLSRSLGRISDDPLASGLKEVHASTLEALQSPALELPSWLFEPNEQALAQLVALEREAANTRNLTLLAQLWDVEGQVVDGQGTVAPEDDYKWMGQRAVLDRYRVAVFPNPPPLRTSLPKLVLQQADGAPVEKNRLEKNRTDTSQRVGSIRLKILLKNGEAQTLATDTENGDEWQFRFHQGRWWLLVLRYATRPA